MYTQPDLFQLTHPTRGATARSLVTAQFRVHFNSHTPHGVRQPSKETFKARLSEFQLTHPTRGATYASSAAFATSTFQLTHPTWGATP